MALDLNLIIALDALLQERSVTRAAHRLGLSQPSLSASLARLRRHYDDELLTRVGNAYELTPLGERLIEQTGPALLATERVLQTKPHFDPGRLEHEYTIVGADCHLPVFGRALSDIIAAEAPGVRIKFQHSTPYFVTGAAENLRTVDAIVLPEGMLASIPRLHLYRDRWVCVVDANTSAEPLTREALNRRPWVVVYQHPFSTSTMSPMPRLLSEGIDIHSTITTESFLSVPYLVAGTDRIGLMPEHVARLSTKSQGITVIDSPIEFGDLSESLWWHPAHERDPAHTWLRQKASQAGRLIDAE